jgi:hypothetical protein
MELVPDVPEESALPIPLCPIRIDDGRNVWRLARRWERIRQRLARGRHRRHRRCRRRGGNIVDRRGHRGRIGHRSSLDTGTRQSGLRRHRQRQRITWRRGRRRRQSDCARCKNGPGGHDSRHRPALHSGHDYMWLSCLGHRDCSRPSAERSATCALTSVKPGDIPLHGSLRCTSSALSCTTWTTEQARADRAPIRCRRETPRRDSAT